MTVIIQAAGDEAAQNQIESTSISITQVQLFRAIAEIDPAGVD
jgi:hypothetical protein